MGSSFSFALFFLCNMFQSGFLVEMFPSHTLIRLHFLLRLGHTSLATKAAITAIECYRQLQSNGHVSAGTVQQYDDAKACFARLNVAV